MSDLVSEMERIDIRPTMNLSFFFLFIDLGILGNNLKVENYDTTMSNCRYFSQCGKKKAEFGFSFLRSLLKTYYVSGLILGTKNIPKNQNMK